MIAMADVFKYFSHFLANYRLQNCMMSFCVPSNFLYGIRGRLLALSLSPSLSFSDCTLF